MKVLSLDIPSPNCCWHTFVPALSGFSPEFLLSMALSSEKVENLKVNKILHDFCILTLFCQCLLSFKTWRYLSRRDILSKSQVKAWCGATLHVCWLNPGSYAMALFGIVTLLRQHSSILAPFCYHAFLCQHSYASTLLPMLFWCSFGALLAFCSFGEYQQWK